MDRSYPTSTRVQSFWDRNPDFKKKQTTAVVRRHSFAESTGQNKPDSDKPETTPKSGELTPKSNPENGRLITKYDQMCDTYLNAGPNGSPRNGERNSKARKVKFAEETTTDKNSQLDESFQKAVCYLQTLTNKVAPGR